MDSSGLADAAMRLSAEGLAHRCRNRSARPGPEPRSARLPRQYVDTGDWGLLPFVATHVSEG
ncbi:hypothetical protein MLGJGCBP_00865 [Rhodococcus sp. T7]|nr:hypothetical protein MLGJGCBP_00865 [Rhodococcus sp. T7]